MSVFLAPDGRLTVAVIRQGEGPRDRFAAKMRRGLLGVHSFTRYELEQMFGDAGLVGFRTLHEHGLWMLAVATRTA